MDSANITGPKLSQCIAALEATKFLWKYGERTEFVVKLTTNRAMSLRNTKYSVRPIPDFRVTGRADRGYGTVREHAKLYFLLLACLFPFAL